MAPDSELVDRVKGGDTEAFGTLITRYERTLTAVAWARLRDRHAAEDAVQSAFLAAFRKLSTLRGGAKFGPWLMQIARREVINTMRRRRVVVSAQSEDAHRTVDDQETNWIEHEHLLSLVSRLSEHEQMLVGLRYFDGFSIAEISGITERPIGTVTKQLSRATARLRTWYGR